MTGCERMIQINLGGFPIKVGVRGAFERPILALLDAQDVGRATVGGQQVGAVRRLPAGWRRLRYAPA